MNIGENYEWTRKKSWVSREKHKQNHDVQYGSHWSSMAFEHLKCDQQSRGTKVPILINFHLDALTSVLNPAPRMQL